jgi:NADPH-dependent 2,4-dienoyl-CoA reductase/sulfur reductase-like enzyme
MFALSAVDFAGKDRAEPQLWLGEVVATAGLILLVFALARSGRAAVAPAAVGAGLRDHTARRAGYDPVTVGTTADDHKAYCPGATPVQARIAGDRRTGRLLRAQLLGSRDAEIAERIDVFAAAISSGAAVGDVSDLDLSYTPPLGSPWDVVQLAATAWQRIVIEQQSPTRA